MVELASCSQGRSGPGTLATPSLLPPLLNVSSCSFCA